MELSEKGLEFHKKWEGFRSKPYLDAAGIPTIGYGTTRYPDGRRVSMQDPEISEEFATEIMRVIIGRFERSVKDLVAPSLKQHQFDALVSFTYNLGPGALSISTLLKRVNEDPDHPTIPNEFTKWIKAGGRPLLGLARRRLQEAYIYTFGWGEFID